jgi:site-specific recombinase XerD
VNYTSGFAEQIINYLDYREALGFSQIKDAYMLVSFDRYCDTNCPKANDLTRKVVRDWIDSQDTSVTNKTTAIRNFAKYLAACGRNAYELPKNRRFIEKRTFLPHMFTEEELCALFMATGKIQPGVHQPHLPDVLPVMFRLIYTCGLRPNEGRELLRENINFTTGAILIVHTKGKKERTVVMSDDMLKLCAEYDKRRREFAGENPYFFPSENGGVFSEQGLQRWFRKCWAEANPDVEENKLPGIRIYDLRHVFATTALTRWIKAGSNIEAKLAYLQAYMGHETINETLYYVHLLPETLLSGGKWETLLRREAQQW